MSNLREIAYKPEDNWSAVWNIVQERDCDPHSKKYSLCHPNGALHSDLRNYSNRTNLMNDAKEEGFNIVTLGKYTAKIKRKADE